MSLPQRFSRPIHSSSTLLCSSSCYSNTTTTTTPTTSTKLSIPPLTSASRLYKFRFRPFISSAFVPELVSESNPFSFQSSKSRCITVCRVSRPSPVNVEIDEELETTELAKPRVLRQKIELLGIVDSHSCAPGLYNHLLCPKCKGGKLKERSLSFHINKSNDFAMWRCFHVSCGWAGQVFADNRVTCNGANQLDKVNPTRQLTVESLGLKPLGDELTSYFSERMISEETLQRNAVMQISGNQKVIAFPYWRNGVLVSCKYRSMDKRFWQEKGTEKILYGLDDIMEADEIIIVEGEIDKLSFEEAGFCNCVSVPDGAPQKVTKELPPIEKDSRFQYLWNCKEYTDKASRIILATDGDLPGQVLAEELARRLGRERCWQVRWPKKDEFNCYKDANEVLKNMGSDALREVIQNAEICCVHNMN